MPTAIRRLGELLHLNETVDPRQTSGWSNLRIALIVSPLSAFPVGYGGTELFVANLAEALIRPGVEVDV